MAEQITFGRRTVPPSAPARPPSQPQSSNPDLEAFAASVRAARASEIDEFARWRRDQLPRRVLIILVRFALLAPGLVCFALQAPWWLSLGLEAAGIAANGWLRRERRRQASAITAWAPEP